MKDCLVIVGGLFGMMALLQPMQAMAEDGR